MMHCIKCDTPVPTTPHTPADFICSDCEARAKRFRGRINIHLDGYTKRWRKNYDGLNIEMVADLLEALDNLGNWEAEKLVAGIIGNDGEAEDWQ
ncbi:MAG: hypothetical protein K9M45_07805 [Kiritimatiellales bacterium]|nr:hypothetical protein [Kiritimatiellales bacterium]